MTPMQPKSTPKKKSLLRLLLIGIPLQLAFGGIFLYIFGLSAKDSDAFQCALQTANQSPVVQQQLGAPLKPDTFVWTSYYESAGSRSEGLYSGNVIGPKGQGDLEVEFFRTPGTSSFLLTLETNDGQTHTLHKGEWPCK